MPTINVEVMRRYDENGKFLGNKNYVLQKFTFTKEFTEEEKNRMVAVMAMLIARDVLLGKPTNYQPTKEDIDKEFTKWSTKYTVVGDWISPNKRIPKPTESK